ncbi:hypothetical protein HYH03_006807 [Edaphochlamys debaryana]|uniref:Uncharacterized protein n=1 Tax=Edaphochlamys debaryana TaxID=47281 RepID=A0A835Y6R6_9CHLO|nr:hypothetical protein HYH03_006807 [Edaphochlamys debaryana]|eukprot:KAG2495201.1 hypothetical protein HYH03_006807 [Edaphochlamys debaryana]
MASRERLSGPPELCLDLEEGQGQAVEGKLGDGAAAVWAEAAPAAGCHGPDPPGGVVKAGPRPADRYQGDTDTEGRPHGSGRMRYGSGELYDGQWRRGKRHGQGSYDNVDGFSYRGGWEDDVATGFGYARFPGGAQYEGEWLRGRRQGWGLLRGAQGEVYEGQWADDTLDGLGRFTHPDGSAFEGSYRGGTRVEGRWTAADGASSYTGSFLGTQRHGQGLLVATAPTRLRYRGEWELGLQQGRGECQYGDGSWYRGQWRAGSWHGEGEWRERAPTDDSDCGGGKGGKGPTDCAWYRGDFVEGVRHGKGTARDAQGNLYTGDWADGRRHGQGSCVFACGDRYTGDWARGERHGRGACSYANGDRYAGSWVHGRREGYGEALFADGVRFRGRWRDDCWVQSTAEPGACVVSGPGLSRAVAGEVATFTIEARDDLGNRRLSGGEGFRVEVRAPSGGGLLGALGALALAGGQGAAGDEAGAGAELRPLEALGPEGGGRLVAEGEVIDTDDGLYEVSYTCTEAGVLELHVLLLPDDPDSCDPPAHVGDSPYILLVSAAGPPCARASRVRGPGRTEAVCGRTTAFVVEPRDVYGNRLEPGQLPPGGVALQVHLGNGNLEVPLAVQAAAVSDSGYVEARVSYTAPAVPGLYRLQVVDAATGRHVGGSPFSVRVLPAEGAEGAPPSSQGLGSTTEALTRDPIANSGASSGADTQPQGAGALEDRVAEWGRRAEAALREADDVPRAPEGPVAEEQGAAVGRSELSAAGAPARMRAQGHEAGEQEEEEEEAVVVEAARGAGISPEERRYVMAHTAVPVVEDLRDLWKAHQVQEERKARELLARLEAGGAGGQHRV